MPGAFVPRGATWIGAMTPFAASPIACITDSENAYTLVKNWVFTPTVAHDFLETTP